MLKKLLFLLILVFSIFTACRKEKFITDSSAKLSFSTDSILFDTVFTTVGSTTKWLKVFNRHNKSITISSIRLGGGANSNFRVNVDGQSGTSFQDVKLLANDSIFIFIEVTVDPNGGNSPLVIADQLVFVTNGNTQDVDLVAWGQDAYYHTPNAFLQGVTDQGDTFRLVYNNVACNTTWLNDKPHLIYGVAVIENNCQLTIEEGADIHFHANSGLWVGNLLTGTSGTLKVNGSKDRPVVFQGDRLEPEYDNIAGQWDRIYFPPISGSSEINYAIIKNGGIGVQVDSTVNLSTPKVVLNNTIITNHSGVGILSLGGSIEANNCLISNCGSYAVGIARGGSYNFTHTTIANYWTLGDRTNPALYLNNYDERSQSDVDLKSANFNNCIIYGNNDNELTLEKSDGNAALFNFEFNHCLIKTDTAITSSEFVNSIKSTTDPFNDVGGNDFRLFEQSIASDVGNATFVNGITTMDLDENTRSTSKPDLGCYEFVP